MLLLANKAVEGAEPALTLNEICREGAQLMLAVALVCEAHGYVEALTGEVGDQARRLVMKNGYHRGQGRNGGRRDRY